MVSRHSTKREAALLLCAALLAGCGARDVEQDGTHGAVVVVAPAIEPVAKTLGITLPGRVVPMRVAEVRARVPGIVLHRRFVEGSDVKAGQVLFEIDPAPSRAALARLQAELARADAALQQAKSLVERYAPLVETHAVSALDFDNARAAHLAARAARQAAQAAVESARLDLQYATVRAPLSGRIGAALVSEGALVGQGEATPLAFIKQIDNVYLDLTQSAADERRLRAALARHGDDAAGKPLTVRVAVDGNDRVVEGTLLFADITVDPTTGQVKARAQMRNPQHALLPGMYVRAHVDLGVDPTALLVPQRAVIFGTDGLPALKIVDKDNVVQLRTVTLGEMQGSQWRIVDGLRPGERVLTSAVATIAPGSKVQLAPA